MNGLSGLFYKNYSGGRLQTKKHKLYINTSVVNEKHKVTIVE